jgi:hypothetical protein
MRRVLIPVFVIVSAVVGVVGRTTAASPAAATTYSYTVSGSDAHSLDALIDPMFVAGGGVEGVYSGGNPAFPYLEIGLDLPVGAKVTSVASTSSYCAPGHDVPVISFGSYEPTTRNTVPNVTLTGDDACAASTVKKTGKPIVTTVAGRRYVMDYQINHLALYPGDQGSVWYGATIKYTCTSPCVP